MILTVHSPQSKTLVETFGDWANANSVERFWGIAVTRDGRACLQLPTDGENFEALLVPVGDSISVVMGEKSDGLDNLEFDAGSQLDSPGAVFDRVTTWLMETAAYSLSQGDFELAIEASHTAWRILVKLQDADGAKAALSLKLAAISA
jgi:hypothetical protein